MWHADCSSGVPGPHLQDEEENTYALAHTFGICGQAPSDYPEFARFLVEQGIDSISLNPDAVLQTLVAIAASEQSLARQRP